MATPTGDNATAEASTAAPTRAGTRFPCGECGAALQFAPGTTALACPYCGAENEIGTAPDAPPVVEQDLRGMLKRLEEAAPHEAHTILKCEACAAEVEPPPNVTATDCPFCGFHLNITQQKTNLIKPAAVLPFAVERQAAQSKFFSWLGSLWFAPSNLKATAQSESKLAGMYVPYWTYDSQTTSHYTGQRGDDYYVTVGSGKNRRTQRRTRWRYVSGTVHVPFDDVLVMASHSLPDKHARNLEPWDLGQIVPYADQYLAGFRSECYQVDVAQGFEIAQGIMEQVIRQAVNRDIGGDHQRISTLQTSHNNLTFKHILLPVWISAYRYHGKIYRFLVNGRTGEVQGERPWSAWKIVTAVVIGLIVVGIIIAIVARS